MYLSAISPLLFAGRSVLYDGSPFQPDLQTLIKLIADQK
jgi:acetoacetyl-CoA synthetase